MVARHHLALSAGPAQNLAIYPALDFVLAGGLLSFGVNFPEVYRQCGLYVGRILKGKQDSELSVQRPTAFDFTINLSAGKARFSAASRG
jgi:putative ABC transport system substrate-binding protein